MQVIERLKPIRLADGVIIKMRTNKNIEGERKIEEERKGSKKILLYIEQKEGKAKRVKECETPKGKRTKLN